MSVPAQTLFDETKCYACYGLSAADLIKVGLLNRILSGEGSSSGGAEPMVYRALVSQDGGVSAPTAVVLENTLAGTPVWTRANTGDYRLTLAGAFSSAKTWYSISTNDDATTPNLKGIAQ
jgi:hypothetical protein